MLKKIESEGKKLFLIGRKAIPDQIKKRKPKKKVVKKSTNI